MRIAVIGAGPAGLTSAKQALAAGHDVVVFEKFSDVGGIWNPASGGAYPSVRMQSSRMSFPFSDFPPISDADFPALTDVHLYLKAYAERFGVTPYILFDTAVRRISKSDGVWVTQSVQDGEPRSDRFDAIMIATGELWSPRVPPWISRWLTSRIMTAKDYRGAEAFAGQRVLVVGGGVSGADIAAELVGTAAVVDWSVRHKHLFLPRLCGDVYNDDLFSYVARIAAQETPFRAFLALLDGIAPEYMALYRQSGMLPSDGFQNAVHVNERIIPAVAAGQVRVVPPAGLTGEDGPSGDYDTVILCLGYQMADYGFVDGFDHTRLYQHFIYAPDPTLTVINTPVDTEAFGTACPYFEAIAGWVLKTLAGQIALPSAADMGAWCDAHMGQLNLKRHYDCWLETIRLKLESGDLADPRVDFSRYWAVVSNRVSPDHLDPLTPAAGFTPAAYDHLFDLTDLKARILASLTTEDRRVLLAEGLITAPEFEAAAIVPPARRLSPHLPYRMQADPEVTHREPDLCHP